ncbi:hypothetical protein L6452_05979 [Arctium lappa]|uniref:Uncharacterized protein n=1 Tax=Arctium lappa TaxID=4217 RepID=A0ACB9EIK8_ARCLA|nr:hypothetical protein L6452_05979 [Arctium lappa]
MMSSLRPDLTNKIYRESSYSFSSSEDKAVNHFDLLSESLLLLIFNKIGDVKALGCCCVVSKRFHTLVPQVENVMVCVECVIFDDDATSASGTSDKSRGLFSSIVTLVVRGIVKPIQALGQFLRSKRSSLLTVGKNIHGDDDDLEVMVYIKVVDGDEERDICIIIFNNGSEFGYSSSETLVIHTPIVPSLEPSNESVGCEVRDDTPLLSELVPPNQFNIYDFDGNQESNVDSIGETVMVEVEGKNLFIC